MRVRICNIFSSVLMSYSQKPLSKCSSLAKSEHHSGIKGVGLQEKPGPLSWEVKQEVAGRERSCPFKSSSNIEESVSMAFLF